MLSVVLLSALNMVLGAGKFYHPPPTCHTCLTIKNFYTKEILD